MGLHLPSQMDWLTTFFCLCRAHLWLCIWIRFNKSWLVALPARLGGWSSISLVARWQGHWFELSMLAWMPCLAYIRPYKFVLLCTCITSVGWTALIVKLLLSCVLSAACAPSCLLSTSALAPGIRSGHTFVPGAKDCVCVFSWELRLPGSYNGILAWAGRSHNESRTAIQKNIVSLDWLLRWSELMWTKALFKLKDCLKWSNALRHEIRTVISEAVLHISTLGFKAWYHHAWPCISIFNLPWCLLLVVQSIWSAIN